MTKRSTCFAGNRGVYPHHVSQWKRDFVTKKPDPAIRVTAKTTVEIKALKKELRRKDKALAEAAAILVLRKKLSTFYGQESEEECQLP